MNVVMVKTEELQIDEGYQRPLDKKRVQRLSRAFQSGACKALSVSRRADGSLFVYDGQHTLAVLRSLGIAECPAVIVNGDRKNEAKWFLLMNGSGVSKATSRDRYQAGIAAEDADFVGIQKLLGQYGLTVSKGGTKAGTTSAINSIKSWFCSDKARLVRAMDVVDRLWCTEDGAWTQIVLRGMWEIAVDQQQLDAVEHGLVKRKVTPRRILDVAGGMQSATGITGGGAAYSKTAILQLAKVRDPQQDASKAV